MFACHGVVGCVCVWLGLGGVCHERNAGRHDCTGLPCRYNKQAVSDGAESRAATGYRWLGPTMEASVL